MLGKLRLVIGVLLMFPMLVLSMVYALLPTSILHLLKRHKAADRYIRSCARFTSNYLLCVFGVKVKVFGLENYPKDAQRLCVISNHQSNLDIPVLFGKGGYFGGIIAKTEMKKVPIVNWWCHEMHCIYLDRKSIRSSIKAIMEGVEDVKKGLAMLIFPEGTRSKTGEVAEFKAGSFNLATRADALLVPFVITGTRAAFEKRTKWTAHVTLTCLLPLDTSKLTPEEKKQIHTTVEASVKERYAALVSDHA